MADRKVPAQTVEDYLNGLDAPFRAAVEEVRSVILASLPEGYDERMVGSMIGYVVPGSRYHCNPDYPLVLAGLAAHKRYCSLHLMALYGDPESMAWFRDAHAARGRKLDMGKACVRFRKAADLDLDLIGQAIARVPMDRYMAAIQKALAQRTPSKQPRRR